MLASLLALSMSIPGQLVWANEGNDDEGLLKVASFNIAAKGAKTSQIGQLIANRNIDLAGLQEVDSFNGRNNKDMIGEIVQAASTNGKTYDGYFQKAIDYSGGGYGIAMAAAAPLNNRSYVQLETGGNEGRVYQRAETEIDGHTVAFYNTHLTWEDASLRAQQMEVLMEALEEDTTTYKVLTGDFNAQDSTEEWNTFLKNYNIANGNTDFYDTYIPSDATMSTNAIDNIITTRNLKLKSVETIEDDEIGSDHRALVAAYEFLDEEEPNPLLLERTLEKAEGLVSQTSRYTPETIAALQSAIDAAKKADRTSQSAIVAAAGSLSTAINNLKTNPADLVAWYDFEGDNPFADKSGRGNDGKAVGTVTWSPSVSDLGQALNTANGYASIAKTTEDLKIGTSDFSVGFWYKATNPGTWSAVLGDKNWDSGANPGFAVVQGQGQFYTTYAANGHGQQENIVSGTAAKVYDGKWHYITAVLDRDDASKLYVDGEMIASRSIESTKDVSVSTPYPFNIGADGNGGYRISSLIDDVRIYKTALPEDQIRDEYQAHRDTSQAALENLQKQVREAIASMEINPDETEKMPEFVSEDGQYKAALFCSENDVLIDDAGNVLRKPLVDTRVQITYSIVKNTEGAKLADGEMIQDNWITVKGSSSQKETDNAKPSVIPALQEWKGGEGSFHMDAGSRILISEADWDLFEDAGAITSEDLHDLFGLVVPVVKADAAEAKAGDVVLTSEGADERLGEQGYLIESGDSLIIRAFACRGGLYGTRSLLQGMVSSGDQTFAKGTAADYPNYPIREFMLDLGRKYFPMWSLKDMMKYAAWFKLTDFQAHLSEDTFNDYSAFRLESDIPHLTSTDGYYTKDEYREFQRYAQKYGVRVITEIDGPAHSRRFVELQNYEDCPEEYKNIGQNATMLNLSEEGGARERVFKLMDDILEEYLGGDDPVIITDAFNIGMDEYSGSADDLRAYAVHMYDKIVNTYHKTAFGWDSNGSLPNASYPAESYPIDDVIINFWKWEEVSGGMKALMDAGYKVVNGDHRWYIVPGAQIGFYDYANEQKLFNEVSAGSMIGWYNGGMKFPEGHPNIVGGNMLLWNDRGMFAGYSVYDIFARQQSQYPCLAQAYWSGKQDAGESFADFKAKLNTLKTAPSMNNLVKDVESKSDLVLSYDFESDSDVAVLADKSGNGYNAKAQGVSVIGNEENKVLKFDGTGKMETSLDALQWPNTLVLDLCLDEAQSGDVILFDETMPEQQCVLKDGQTTGQEHSQIVLKENADGTYALTWSREGFTYQHSYTFQKGVNYRIALSFDESKITGGEYSKWNQPAKMYVNGSLVSTLQGPAKPEGFTGSSWWVDSPSMNIPLQTIGENLTGTIDNLKLYNRVLSDAEIQALGSASELPDIPDSEPEDANIALNKPVTASSFKNGSLTAANINDGSMDTRWASNYNSSTNEPFDKQEWIQFDLESSVNIGEVRLFWENAYAKSYTVQVSEDGEHFEEVYRQTDGKGDSETISLSNAKGRYLRLLFTESVPSNDSWKWNYGYSLFEAEVYKAKETVQADKTLLAGALAYARTLDTSSTNPIVKARLESAIAAAQAVMDNESASQEEVNAAWNTLCMLIHMSGFTSDKSALSLLVSQAESLDLSQYQDTLEKDVFRDALAAAKEVLDDPAALNGQSIERAIDQLSAAMAALIRIDETIDTSLLALVIDEAGKLDLSLYLEAGKADFTEALASAKDVLANPQTQQQVNDAALQLNARMLALRLRPDEALLASLRSFSQAMALLDRSKFSAEELSSMDALHARVDSALNNTETFDQKAAEDLVKETAPWMALIEERTASKAGASNSVSNEDASAKPAASASVKTAGNTHSFWYGLGAAAGAGLLALLKRRNRKNETKE